MVREKTEPPDEKKVSGSKTRTWRDAGLEANTNTRINSHSERVGKNGFRNFNTQVFHF